MSEVFPAIESLTPADGEPDRQSTAAEFEAWAMRRRLPSELAHKLAWRWPLDVAEATGIPAATLKAMRQDGDHPRLYALGRALFTTRADALEWLQAHELAPGALVRPATAPKRASRRIAA